MKKIDDELGGTTPLNIIIRFPSNKTVSNSEKDELDDWEENNQEDKAKYWLIER